MSKKDRMLNLLKDGKWHDFEEIVNEAGWEYRNSIDVTLIRLSAKGYVFERRNIWGVKTEVKLISIPKGENDPRALDCQIMEICNGHGCYRAQSCVAFHTYKLSRFAHTLGLKQNANQNRKQQDSILRQL